MKGLDPVLLHFFRNFFTALLRCAAMVGIAPVMITKNFPGIFANGQRRRSDLILGKFFLPGIQSSPPCSLRSSAKTCHRDTEARGVSASSPRCSAVADRPTHGRDCRAVGDTPALMISISTIVCGIVLIGLGVLAGLAATIYVHPPDAPSQRSSASSPSRDCRKRLRGRRSRRWRRCAQRSSEASLRVTIPWQQAASTIAAMLIEWACMQHCRVAASLRRPRCVPQSSDCKKSTQNGARYQGRKLICSRPGFLGCSEAWRWRC